MRGTKRLSWSNTTLGDEASIVDECNVVREELLSSELLSTPFVGLFADRCFLARRRLMTSLWLVHYVDYAPKTNT